MVIVKSKQGNEMNVYERTKSNSSRKQDRSPKLNTTKQNQNLIHKINTHKK